jgi:hypothetical protein
MGVSLYGAVLLVLAGLVTVEPATAQTVDAAKKRLAVLVAAGDEVNMLRVAVLVFGNQYGRVKVPADEVAAPIYDAIRAQIEIEDTHVVTRVPVRREELAALRKNAIENSFWTGAKVSAAAIRPFADRCDCDALLLAVETEREVPGTNQKYLGITWHNGADGKRNRMVVPISLFLIDPQSLAVAASAWTMVAGASFNAEWPGPADKVQSLGQDVWAAVGEGVRADLRQSLREPLTKMSLRPSCQRYLYEKYTTPRERDPSNPSYREPPDMSKSDNAKCLK